MVSIRVIATSVPVFYEIFLIVVVISADETANAFNVAGMFLIVVGEYFCVCATERAGFEIVVCEFQLFFIVHLFSTSIIALNIGYICCGTTAFPRAFSLFVRFGIPVAIMLRVPSHANVS